jgi:hypothetical protein
MIKIIKSLTTTSSDKKTFSSSHIEQFLDDVRRFDETIGNYEQHLMLHDQFTYSIELTNGIIMIYTEELEDKKALPQERLRDIAARFRERKTSLF